MNPLDYGANPAYRAAVGGTFMKALEKLAEAGFEGAPRLKRILENSIEAVVWGLERPTIMDLVNFLRSEEYREQVIGKVDNPEVLGFWRKEFPDMAGAKQADALQPAFTRLSPLLIREQTKHVLVQRRTTLPIRAMMDAGKILLVDVSANNPEVGERNATALGILLVNAIWGAVSTRIKDSFDIPAFLWIDEFHRFVTKDVEKMLAEARGFGLGVYLATQYYNQLEEWMRQAIINNVWTRLVGRTNGPQEAALAAKIFTGVTPEAILSLPKYTYIAQVTSGGSTSKAFTVETLPPFEPDELWASYKLANGGKLPVPQDFGAVPLDFFAGVALMGASERTTWNKHRQAMDGQDLKGRAAYLAGLPEAEFERYCSVRRQADHEEYQRILNDSRLVPDVALDEELEAQKSVRELAKLRRVLRLSLLQVGTPRDEIEADISKQMLTVESSVKSFDDLVMQL
jgi:hypothetical protein